MCSSKLTSRFRVTIPKKIRKALRLGIGDSIVFLINGDDDAVALKKFNPIDKSWAQALNYTLSDWNSEVDNAAFEHLQKP